MTYFVDGVQNRYRTLCNDPAANIAARLAEISRIEIATIEGRVTQAGAIRRETDGEFAYPLNFVKDQFGIWKVLGF
jgi:hypothetical protein